MENEKFYILNSTFYLQNVVGLDGLEPSTSRLSGVRSNQNWAIGPFRSYTPKIKKTLIFQNWTADKTGVDLGMSRLNRLIIL